MCKIILFFYINLSLIKQDWFFLWKLKNYYSKINWFNVFNLKQDCQNIFQRNILYITLKIDKISFLNFFFLKYKYFRNNNCYSLFIRFYLKIPTNLI